MHCFAGPYIFTRNILNHRAILDLIVAISREPFLVALLSRPVDPSDDKDAPSADTVLSLLRALAQQAALFMRLHQGNAAEEEGADDGCIEKALCMALQIDTAFSQCELRVRQAQELGVLPLSGHTETGSRKRSRAEISSSSGGGKGMSDTGWEKLEEEQYIRELRPLKFEAISLLDEVHSGRASHALLNARQPLGGSSSSGAPTERRQWVSRVASEMSSLMSALPVEHGSAVFVRCDESRMDVLKALIVGPEGTPYANGCFEFDLLLPPSYPNSPPLAQLVTTGKGRVRFNPNLYQCGKVCLSLLGTWDGPSWDRERSTLLQVLVSIQSLILVPDPYFNEPGYERSMNTKAGRKLSTDYNTQVRRDTAQHAILEQLRYPSPVFADVIRAHYRIKRRTIIEQLDGWANADRELRPTAEAVIAELSKSKYTAQEPAVLVDSVESPRKEFGSHSRAAVVDLSEPDPVSWAPSGTIGLESVLVGSISDRKSSTVADNSNTIDLT